MRTPRLSRRIPDVRLGYVTEMHWPRRPEKTPYRDKTSALSCFIQKRVSLRLFTVKTLLFPNTEANQQWIGSFPADRCDQLIKSNTSFSSVHPSAVEPENELRPKWCKITFKYAFKLIFLKFIFEFMINTVPPNSNSDQRHVKRESYSKGASSNPSEGIRLNFAHFFPVTFLITSSSLPCFPLFSLLIL